MLALPQLDMLAVVPLNFTQLLPWLDPKFEPLIVTEVVATPEVGDKLVIVGSVTVKLEPLLSTPFLRTTTLPVVAPEGTVVEMLVSLQVDTLAAVPLNFTVLVP